MTDMTHAKELGPIARTWRIASSADALQLVAEGVATFAGFRIATMLIVDDDMLECIAVAGESTPSGMLGSRSPKRFLCEALEASEHWGPLRFLSHETLDPEALPHGVLPGDDVSDDPDAWHPLNGLVLPIQDRDGALRAALSIDHPLNGRIPDPEQRRQLESYSRHAHRAILTTLDREKLAERFALAGAARRVVRAASGALSHVEVLERSQSPLLDGFAADELWWQLLTVPEPDLSSQSAVGAGTPPGLDHSLLEETRAVAQQAWREQSVIVVHAERPADAADSHRAEIVALAEEFLTRDQIGSLLVIPLGEGEEPLGLVVLHRRDGADWTLVETQEALDVGHDLGRALLNARSHERELAQVRRLEAVDLYKSQLISTLAHELRTPLTTIMGNVELIQELISEGNVGPLLTSTAAATDRGAERMAAIVEDLLVLSRVTDPHVSFLHETVDLSAIVTDVVALHSSTARKGGVELVVAPAPEPVFLQGVPSELDRVVVNLVSNAVKYSPAGSTVRVGAEYVDSEAVLVCTDDGHGISEADQRNLFREFFRSDDPRMSQVRGTGLGLAIVQRIIDRHGGRIEVDSQLGVGSTFRVHLPRTPG